MLFSIFSNIWELFLVLDTTPDHDDWIILSGNCGNLFLIPIFWLIDLFSKSDLNNRAIKQKNGLKKRFPQLPGDIIESTWSGIVSRTRNSSQIFEKIDNNTFVAGCYNGSGIGVGTLFGEQIAIKASNENSSEIDIIEARAKPNWLPPQPFLNLGIYTRLAYERFKARSET